MERSSVSTNSFLLFASMGWVKKQILGKGSYGTVHLAIHGNSTPPNDEVDVVIPAEIAVKSAVFSSSSSLLKEGEILYLLNECPNIVHCFGEDISDDKNGRRIYNLLLEFAPGGTLKDLINKGSGKLSELEVKRYIRMILKGLRYVHEKGYVHCDIKPQNILVFPSSDNHGINYVKIADFGLAKRRSYGLKLHVTDGLNGHRGTAMCTSPESVFSLNEAPKDIWAMGCTMVEMVTGKSPWNFSNKRELLYEIGFGTKIPEIPERLSPEGKDFLARCLMREHTKRWTAEMLLNHPFIMDSHESTLDLDEINCSMWSDKWISQRSMFEDPPSSTIVATPQLVPYSPEFDWLDVMVNQLILC